MISRAIEDKFDSWQSKKQITHLPKVVNCTDNVIARIIRLTLILDVQT